MSEPRTIAELVKNNTETVRVALVDLNGHHLCDVRILADVGGGDRIPTRKGICVGVGLIPGLIKALQDAAREASR